MELSELIESVDILEYISQYTEFTEKNGEYWALSPFKDEKTPSFSVRKETNSFYDFSSGIGGNVLTFIRYYDKCGYAEAIEYSARDCAPQPLKLSIHSGGIEHPRRCR